LNAVLNTAFYGLKISLTYLHWLEDTVLFFLPDFLYGVDNLVAGVGILKRKTVG
jgi:hypothetical protein